MIIETILVIIFVLLAAGDCYSTAKMLRYNHKMAVDKKFRRKVLRKLREGIKKDESKAEMMKIPRHLIKKYGGDRAMLYIGVFGYGPLSLALFYFLLTDADSLLTVVFLIGLMFGMLFKQIMKAITLKKQFGIKI